MKYKILFVSGILEGITTVIDGSVKMDIGRTYTPCAGSSKYKVLEEVA